MAFNPHNDGDMDGVQNKVEGGTVDQGYLDAGSGMSMASFMPAITSALGVIATGEDIAKKNEVLMENMANEAENLQYKQGQSAQKLDDMDRVLGDKLSASGLEAMKRESRLKAASAETGGTGGSVDSAIATAEMDKLHRDAVILRTYDVNKANQQQQMVADRLNFENTTESMLTGQQSSLSAGLQTLNAGVSGISTGLSFLNDSQKEKFFGTDTTGTQG